jgi:hypothetical protein
VRAAAVTPSLILKRGALSRSSGEWRDDDYDVLEDGVVVGRIFLSPGAPQERPWMWASGHSADSVRRAAHGYEPTREAAMAAFAKSWRREPEDTVTHTNTSRRASRHADNCEGD